MDVALPVVHGRLCPWCLTADLYGIFMISTSEGHVHEPILWIPRWGICLVLIVTSPDDETPSQLKRLGGLNMTTTMYAVEGMVCESCMAAVLVNVQSLSGVSVVAMDLVSGGQSPMIVTSGTKLGADAVRHVIEHVGFGVVPPRDLGLSERANGPAGRELATHSHREPLSSVKVSS